MSGIEIINVRNVNGSPAVAAVPAVAEQQTVTLSGTAAASANTAFLGVNTAVLINETAAQVAAKIVLNKASVLAGATAVSLGITDITADGAVLTLTFGGANGVGNVAAITASATSNGTVYTGGTETRVGSVAVAAVAATGGTDTFDANNIVGMTEFNNVLSSNGVAVTNMKLGQSLGIVGNATSTIGTTDGTYGATVVSGALNLSGGTQTSSGSLVGAGAVTAGGAALATFTVNSAGAANSIASLTFGGNAITTLNINATSTLNIGAAGTISGFSAALPSTINITGAGDVRLNTLAAALDTVNGSTATGSITLTLGAATQVVRTGSGNDIISTGGIDLTTGSVNAGAGTGDRLVVVATDDVDTAGEANLYSNFEVVQIGSGAAAATVDLDLFATNNTITGLRFANNVNGVRADNVTATQAANVAIVGLATNNAALTSASLVTINIDGATDGGQIDTVKATLTTTTSRGFAQAIDLATAPIALAGVEKLELTGTGTSTATSGVITLNTGASVSLDSIKLTTAGGTAAASNSIVIAAGHRATNLVVDASASSGSVTIDASLYATATGGTFKGGTGADSILGSDLTDVLSGGGARDFFNNDNASVVTAIDKITDYGSFTVAVSDTSTIASAADLQAVGVTAGGANLDLIDFGTQAAARATVVAVATDVAAASGDATLDITATMNARGLITLAGANASAINTAAEALAVFLTLNTVDGGVGVLNVGTTSYVMLEDNAGGAGDDFVIELSNVTLTGVAIATGTGLVGEAFVI